MVEKRKYSDRSQYLIRAVHARRKKVRKMAVEYKGGKCEVCGYDRCIEALEFHHNDLSSKEFGISAKGYTRSWNNVMKELDKCQLSPRTSCTVSSFQRKRWNEKRVNSGKA